MLSGLRHVIWFCMQGQRAKLHRKEGTQTAGTLTAEEGIGTTSLLMQASLEALQTLISVNSAFKYPLKVLNILFQETFTEGVKEIAIANNVIATV